MRRLDAWDAVAGFGFLLLGALLVLPLGKLLLASVVDDREGQAEPCAAYPEFLGCPYYSRTIGHSFLVSEPGHRCLPAASPCRSP